MKSSIHAKIEEKARELQDLKEIMKFTDALASKLDSISEQLAVMGDGAESVALILSNWQNVVSSVSLASLAVANHAKGPSQNTEPMPETLVRLRLQDQDAQADE